MQFNEHANVLAADGEKVGEIERVVLDPQTGKVTHLVVQQGFLFTEDKVMPVEFVATTSKDKVTLKEEVGDIEDLPPFREVNYVPLRTGEAPNYPPTAAPPLYGYPPAGTAWWAWPGYPGYVGYPGRPYVVEEVDYTPPSTVALKEGANVYSADGEHVGDVERVFADETTEHITQFIISQGLLFKERKRVPTSWVQKVDEGSIYLNVNADQLEDVPDYSEET